ncbi:respiratory chain complex I component [Pseudohyphozyma bogoriensis]|nr:respiratory chain complex I component [Pseudohyphozyma bogoriensis]
MASGFGYTGGRSRCFAFWQDFQKCYAKADLTSECSTQVDDYLECLHHNKEVARAMEIKTQYLTKTVHELEQKRKKVEEKVESGILGLGLLGAEKDEAK